MSHTSFSAIGSSQCFESSRVINPEEHTTFIKENTCLFCNKLASDICQCQLGCGALFGYGCFSSPDIDACPKCQKTVDQDKQQYKNRYINKLVSQQVSLKCINFDNGCKEALPYSSESVERHEKQCNYFTVQCSKNITGCQWQGANELKEIHERECGFKQVECQACKDQNEDKYTFVQENFAIHQKECLNISVNKAIDQLAENLDESKLNQQLYKLIQAQKEKISEGNKKANEIIKYAVSLETKDYKQRDKSILLNDFKSGIVNFNSLENLQKTLDCVDRQFVKGVKLNDTNLTCYEYSFASKIDFSQTLKTIEKFAQNGEKNSQYSLARLYYWGDKEIPQNIKKTEFWVEKALKQNSAEAYWLKGDLYYENKGNQSQNYEKAFKYYEQASQMGNPEATNSLGQMYDDGEGYPCNEKKALECFQKSARLGDYGGLYNLAVYHQEGYGGIKKDLESAFKYYLLSAKKGDIDAMKRVAISLRQGKGVEKNQLESAKWAKRAGYYKNKYNQEIPSASTMGGSTFNSLSSINCNSSDNIRSDVI